MQMGLAITALLRQHGVMNTSLTATRLHRLLCLSSLSLLLASSACAEDPMKSKAAASPSNPTTSAAPKAEPASAQLWREIKAEIGDAECDGPQQCHTIGVGAKACGGPEGYLAWSSKTTDGKKLKSLVERHSAARDEENRRSGMASNCAIPQDPGAACVAEPSGRKVCKLNSLPTFGGQVLPKSAQ